VEAKGYWTAWRRSRLWTAKRRCSPPSTEPMSPMDETELHRLWDRVIRRAKVRHRPPEVLQHTCISLLLSRGAPLLQVAQQTGHSPVVLLKFYAKWLPQDNSPQPRRNRFWKARANRRSEWMKMPNPETHARISKDSWT